MLPTPLTRYAGPPTVPGYTVDEFLGRGATGVVWAATSRESGERVALKVLAEEGALDLDAVRREEEFGHRVEGRHLLSVRGRVPLDDGRLALVMGLADGGSLRDVVTIRGALPLGEVVTALTPIAGALAELHAAGVVHADVAPGNLLFTGEGRPMLADLSSAWLVDDGWPRHARGTPGFAAPEVALVRPPVPGSDVWSLAALAWYARTGGLTPPPWIGDLHWARAVGVQLEADDEVGTLDDVTAAVGPELAPLLVRMLADEPDHRPSASEVALALYRSGAPEPVRLVGHHPDPAAAVTTRIRREAAETRSRSERREAERVERQRVRRERRRRRLWRTFVPWRVDPGAGAGPTAPTGPGSGPAAGRRRPKTGGAGTAPGGAGSTDRGVRRTREAGAPGSSGSHRDGGGSWRLRLVGVVLAALVLAGGLLGLMRMTGSSLNEASRRVAETSAAGVDGVPSSPPGQTVDTGTDATATGAAATGAAGTGTAGTGTAATGAAGRGTAATGAAGTGSGGAPARVTPAEPSTPQPSPTESQQSGTNPSGSPSPPAAAAARPSEDVSQDPTGTLQRLADLRTAALVAADPVLLVGAEPAGSLAYENDVRTVMRLREQRQRYEDLSFTVRTAEVVTTDPASVVLRAVVDRSAYQVVTEGGDEQQVGAGPGTPLRYTLSRTDGGWRLVEVGPP